MNDVTPDLVIRYLAGEVRDPLECERIESARATDPQVSRWFQLLEEEIEAHLANDLEPSQASGHVRSLFEWEGYTLAHPDEVVVDSPDESASAEAGAAEEVQPVRHIHELWMRPSATGELVLHAFKAAAGIFDEFCSDDETISGCIRESDEGLLLEVDVDLKAASRSLPPEYKEQNDENHIPLIRFLVTGQNEHDIVDGYLGLHAFRRDRAVASICLDQLIDARAVQAQELHVVVELVWPNELDKTARDALKWSRDASDLASRAVLQQVLDQLT